LFRRVGRFALTAALLLLLVVAVVVLGLRFATYARVGKELYTDPGAVPRTDFVMVLASGGSRTRPSEAATIRLDTALSLLRAAGSRTVLLSGQPFEVEPMQRYLVARGVNSDSIMVDDGSARTVESCERAKLVYGARSVTVVSQEDHAARAVYTCQLLGLAANALVAPDFGGTPFLVYRLHELVALPLAWWELNVGWFVDRVRSP
jgi:vancomycin permeability regulator SanA